MTATSPPVQRVPPAFSLLVANGARYAGLLILVALASADHGAPAVNDIFLAIAIASPSFIVLGFGLRELVLTLDSEASFRTYLHVRLATALVALLIPSIVGMVLGGTLGVVVVLMALVKTADAMTDLFFAYLQKHGEYHRIAGCAVAGAFLSIGGWLLAGTVAHDLLFQLTCFVAGAWLVVPYLMWHRAQIASVPAAPPTPRAARALVQAGFPLGLSWGMLTLTTAIPQYVLSSLGQRDDSTKFALLIYVGVVAEILLNAVVQAWIPKARDMRAAGHFGTRQVWRAALPATIAAVPGATAAFGVLAFIATHKLLDVHHLQWSELPPILVGTSLMPAVFYMSMSLSIVNRYGASLQASGVTLVFVAAGALTAIPHGGLLAALWLNAAAVGVRILVTWLAFTRPAPAADPGSRTP